MLRIDARGKVGVKKIMKICPKLGISARFYCRRIHPPQFGFSSSSVDLL
jgi:hypothetical protein